MEDTMVESSSLPGQQRWGNTVFPFSFQWESAESALSDAVQWVNDRRDELLRLSTVHGAVLLRGYPLKTAQDFDAVVSALKLPNFPYQKSLSNAVRVNRTERVFTANEAPADYSIFFHHEMAQTPLFPAKILFFCELPAVEGGATPICRSDVLYEQLKAVQPQFIADCEAKGLRYTNVMPDDNDLKSSMGRSWKNTLEVTSREAAEARLAELNYSWEWLPDGCLKATTPPLPAVMEISPGRKTFFNQMIAAYRGWKDSRNDISEAIRHGDGTPLDVKAVSEAIKLSDDLAFDVQWQAGDAVLIDNTVAMHARRPFTGPRKVLASLAEMRTQQFELLAT
jgi:hypothetical protein